MENDWKFGLWHCFTNCGLCIVTFVFPCWTAGRNAEQVGESFGYHALMSCLRCPGIVMRAQIREKIRDMQGIEGSLWQDVLLHMFCAEFALIQEANEMTSIEGGGAQTFYRAAVDGQYIARH